MKTQGVMTLRGDFARSFNENVLENVDAPVIAVFAGFHVSEYLAWIFFLTGKPNLRGTASSVSIEREIYLPCIDLRLRSVQWVGVR